MAEKSEMINIKNEDIDESPSLGTKVDTEFISGMAKMEGGVKVLLDIDRVLSGEKTAEMEEVISGTA